MKTFAIVSVAALVLSVPATASPRRTPAPVPTLTVSVTAEDVEAYTTDDSFYDSELIKVLNAAQEKISRGRATRVVVRVVITR